MLNFLNFNFGIQLFIYLFLYYQVWFSGTSSSSSFVCDLLHRANIVLECIIVVAHLAVVRPSPACISYGFLRHFQQQLLRQILHLYLPLAFLLFLIRTPTGAQQHHIHVHHRPCSQSVCMRTLFAIGPDLNFNAVLLAKKPYNRRAPSPE